MPHRYAVIDVGTNSVKFLIAERDAVGGWRTLVDRSETTRLGEGLVSGGTIGTKGVARTATAIAGMVDEARRSGVVAMAAAGTAALRMAANGEAVVAEIASRTGKWVTVIDGDEESRLGFLAVEIAIGDGDGVLGVLDTGGGSSQFTFGRGRQVDKRFSLDVGAIRYTEAFRLSRRASRKTVAAATDAISAALAALDGCPQPENLVAMGGAVTNMAAVMLGLMSFDRRRVEGASLEASEIDRQIELYRRANGRQRRAIPGLQPKRADVILAGACIVRAVMAKLGRESLTVTSRGLRHGILADRFGAVTLDLAEPRLRAARRSPRAVGYAAPASRTASAAP